LAGGMKHGIPLGLILPKTGGSWAVFTSERHKQEVLDLNLKELTKLQALFKLAAHDRVHFLAKSQCTPGPQSHWVHPCNLNRWEHGSWELTTSPCYVPSMTWMSTWQHFLEVRFGTCCWELG
jgi:hypothetical protein